MRLRCLWNQKYGYALTSSHTIPPRVRLLSISIPQKECLGPLHPSYNHPSHLLAFNLRINAPASTAPCPTDSPCDALSPPLSFLSLYQFSRHSSCPSSHSASTNIHPYPSAPLFAYVGGHQPRCSARLPRLRQAGLGCGWCEIIVLFS